MHELAHTEAGVCMQREIDREGVQTRYTSVCFNAASCRLLGETLGEGSDGGWGGWRGESFEPDAFVNREQR